MSKEKIALSQLYALAKMNPNNTDYMLSCIESSLRILDDVIDKEDCKKVDLIYDGSPIIVAKCPRCKKPINYLQKGVEHCISCQAERCQRCGQALDWSDINK